MNEQPETAATVSTPDNLASDGTVVVLQPGYLPWLGFFDQMQRSDIFVYYDDVQFDKHGWRNRNRIKSPNGPHWLTVPVCHRGKDKPRICDVEIDNRQPWARKHLGTIRQFYASSPYLADFLPDLEALLSRQWDLLVDLDLAVIEQICVWLGLKPNTVRASEISVHGAQSDRLLNICQRYGACRYLSGDAAKDYLDVDQFRASGIDVEWHDYRHPTYTQLHGTFTPHLSVLDLLLNCGEGSADVLGFREGSIL